MGYEGLCQDKQEVYLCLCVLAAGFSCSDWVESPSATSPWLPDLAPFLPCLPSFGSAASFFPEALVSLVSCDLFTLQRTFQIIGLKRGKIQTFVWLLSFDRLRLYSCPCFCFRLCHYLLSFILFSRCIVGIATGNCLQTSFPCALPRIIWSLVLCLCSALFT